LRLRFLRLSIACGTLFGFRPVDARADVAAPLPSRDIRWSMSLGGTGDIGTVPRAALGATLGFEVRRGALEARVLSSWLLPTVDRSGTTLPRIGVVDSGVLVCALGPLGLRYDIGACGGFGLGVFYATGPAATDVVRIRVDGLALARFEAKLTRVFAIGVDAGTVFDPFRTPWPGASSSRASAVAARATLSVLVRVW